jgi:hypothetical protein
VMPHASGHLRSIFPQKCFPVGVNIPWPLN